MKLYLTAAAFAAALVQPASATTFPTLTTIYVGAGIEDSGATSANTATVIFCSNVSGVTASIRFLILDDGNVRGDLTVSRDHAQDVTIATQSLAAIATLSLPTDLVSGGTVNIESTQSGVFCTAAIVDTNTSGPNGVALNLVRVNPHPGTVE